MAFLSLTKYFLLASLSPCFSSVDNANASIRCTLYTADLGVGLLQGHAEVEFVTGIVFDYQQTACRTTDVSDGGEDGRNRRGGKYVA